MWIFARCKDWYALLISNNEDTARAKAINGGVFVPNSDVTNDLPDINDKESIHQQVPNFIAAPGDDNFHNNNTNAVTEDIVQALSNVHEAAIAEETTSINTNVYKRDAPTLINSSKSNASTPAITSTAINASKTTTASSANKSHLSTLNKGKKVKRIGPRNLSLLELVAAPIFFRPGSKNQSGGTMGPVVGRKTNLIN